MLVLSKGWKFESSSGHQTDLVPVGDFFIENDDDKSKNSFFVAPQKNCHTIGPYAGRGSVRVFKTRPSSKDGKITPGKPSKMAGFTGY